MIRVKSTQIGCFERPSPQPSQVTCERGVNCLLTSVEVRCETTRRRCPAAANGGSRQPRRVAHSTPKHKTQTSRPRAPPVTPQLSAWRATPLRRAPARAHGRRPPRRASCRPVTRAPPQALATMATIEEATTTTTAPAEPLADGKKIAPPKKAQSPSVLWGRAGAGNAIRAAHPEWSRVDVGRARTGDEFDVGRARTGDEFAELALQACLDPRFERRCNHFTRERFYSLDVVDEACDLSFLRALAVKHPHVKHMATVSGEACAAIVERGGSLEAACCTMDFSKHVPAWYRRSRIRVARRARVRLRPARTVRLRAGAAS